MSTTTRSGPGRRNFLIAAVALALLLGVASWWLLAQADPAPTSGATTSGATPAAPRTSSAAAAPSPAAKPAPTPGATPATTPPASAAPAAAAPSAGSLEPVPYAEVTPEPAVPLRATADFGTGLTVRVTKVETVRSVAKRPGEISAPAVRVTMRAENDSSKAISVEDMVVVLDHGPERTPAINVVEPGGEPFAGALAPGASTRAVYVFNVPEAERERVRLTTSYSGSAPTLVLAGSMS